MDATHRNPTLFCLALGLGAFVITLVYLCMRGLTSSLFVRSLAIGFFSGSMTFSILSLQNRAASGKKETSSRIPSLVFISFLVGAAIALLFSPSNDYGKSAEILIIVAGLASLLVGFYMEKHLA